MKITEQTPVDQIIDEHPEAGKFFFDKKIKYIVCSECSWSPLKDVIMQSGYKESDIPGIIDELNIYLD